MLQAAVAILGIIISGVLCPQRESEYIFYYKAKFTIKTNLVRIFSKYILHKNHIVAINPIFVMTTSLVGNKYLQLSQQLYFLFRTLVRNDFMLRKGK